MADLQAELNRLAGTTGLDSPGAANVIAGTTGLDLVGALNVKAGTTGLEMNGVCRLLAATYGGNAGLDAQGALASINGWGDEVLITETTLSADTASFDFTSIPATYKDLRIVLVGRGTTAANNVAINLRFNGDTGANYDDQFLSGNNASAAAGANVVQTKMQVLRWISAGLADAGRAGHGVIEVYGYAGTTFNKTVHSRGVLSQSTSAAGQGVNLTAGSWKSTAAINQVTVFPAADNFLAGSTCRLYGV
jgi:hypothetical protein